MAAARKSVLPSARYAIVAGVILVIGSGFIVASIIPDNARVGVTLDPGETHVKVFATESIVLGKLTLDYYTGSLWAPGADIRLLVFAEREYEDYVTGNASEPIEVISGNHGVVKIPLNGMGRFHVVAEHGPGYESQTQDVTVSCIVRGFNLAQGAIGLPVFAAGMIVLVIGWKVRGGPGAYELRPRPSDAVNPYGFKHGKWPGK